MANLPAGGIVVNKEEEAQKQRGLPLRWKGGKDEWTNMKIALPLYAGFEILTTGDAFTHNDTRGRGTPLGYRL